MRFRLLLTGWCVVAALFTAMLVRVAQLEEVAIERAAVAEVRR